MAKRSRRNHSPAFKAKAALLAVRGDLTMAELAKKFDIHPNLITQWKTQLLGNAVPAARRSARAAGARWGALGGLASMPRIGNIVISHRFVPSVEKFAKWNLPNRNGGHLGHRLLQHFKGHHQFPANGFVRLLVRSN